MFFYIYMMQNHIFSNVDGTYDAQNGPKWPSKHPKIAQNSPKPKKKPKNFTPACNFLQNESPYWGWFAPFWRFWCSKSPLLSPKSQKVHFSGNCQNKFSKLKNFAYIIGQKHDFLHLVDVKSYIFQR